ncbi:BON domain-containing protein [Massilia sp. LXY-6]|uniref:BON domain-containing protein n=1 Tax=Massilia sp. LXY-6 TaxID=3379823 RepID=UPI003EE3D5FA
MKTLIATLFATAAGAAFAAPTVALNHDPASYRAVTQKAAADYKAASAKCGSMSGNDKDVCMAEARLTRTRTESDALAQYNNTAKGREKARTNLADAEYDLAKTKCGAKSGADKDDCMNNARSVHTAALADAKSGSTASGSSASGATGSSATGSSSGGGLVAGTDTREPAKAAAVDKCAQQGGDSKTGCLVQTKPSTVKDNAGQVANRTENAADRAGDKTAAAASTAAAKTKDVAATVAEKTREAAHTAVEKTKEVAHTVAQKTENAADRAGDKTRDSAAVTAQKSDNAMDNAGDKTRDAAGKTRLAASDTAITTKVKAGLVKEPDLESLGIHVETEKGVVMLSGFVNSKAEADKAVKVAKGVDGVTTVKSAIKVK